MGCPSLDMQKSPGWCSWAEIFAPARCTAAVRPRHCFKLVAVMACCESNVLLREQTDMYATVMSATLFRASRVYTLSISAKEAPSCVAALIILFLRAHLPPRFHDSSTELRRAAAAGEPLDIRTAAIRGSAHRGRTSFA